MATRHHHHQQRPGPTGHPTQPLPANHPPRSTHDPQHPPHPKRPTHHGHNNGQPAAATTARPVPNPPPLTGSPTCPTVCSGTQSTPESQPGPWSSRTRGANHYRPATPATGPLARLGGRRRGPVGRVCHRAHPRLDHHRARRPGRHPTTRPTHQPPTTRHPRADDRHQRHIAAQQLARAARMGSRRSRVTPAATTAPPATSAPQPPPARCPTRGPSTVRAAVARGGAMSRRTRLLIAVGGVGLEVLVVLLTNPADAPPWRTAISIAFAADRCRHLRPGVGRRPARQRPIRAPHHRLPTRS